MSRKRGKNKPSKSKAKATDAAVPEEVLAEGSGPNEEVDADIQALADAASDALPPPADVEIKAKKTRLTTDAWGQPIEVEEEDEPVAQQLADEIEEDAIAETQAEEQDFEEAVLEAEAEAGAEAIEAVTAVVIPDELAAVAPEGDEVADEELGAALPTTAASMDEAQLKNLVEALVFAADKPVTVQRLRQLSRVSDVKRLETALEQLAADYAPRGVALQQVSGGYQFRTNTQYSVWVQQLIAGRPVRLSRAQLETLAIVAYRQPITRPEVDDIRGVDSSATLRLLLDRSLIRVLGKKEDVGRPTLYGTTKEFLDFFSLSDLRELPTLREYSELTAESRKVMSDRLGIDADAIPSSSESDDVALDDDLPPVDQAADDAAAVAAVAAVTDVYGLEGQDLSSNGEPAEDAVSSTEDSSGETLEASSTETSESDVEASSTETSESDVEASSTETSDSDVEASTSETSESDVEASSTETTASDVEASSTETESDVEASTSESVDLSGETLEASSTETTASDVEASMSESVDLSGETHEASSTETSESDLEASTSESMDLSGENVDASSSEDLETSGEDVASTNEDSAEAIEASASEDIESSASEGIESSSERAGESLEASTDDIEMSATETDSDDAVGMPRGAAQRDIIGRSTDLDEDPVLRAAAEAELDAAVARADADQEANRDSDALADDESSTDDLAAAGKGETGGSDVSDAAGTPDSSVLDASAAESLDETDEPPAD